MCVIMVASKRRPTEEMVERAWNSNDHGGGIAWREQVLNDDGTPVLNVKNEPVFVVRWKKGITTLAEMQKLCAIVPLPNISHFRIASVGGKDPRLTHPFPITDRVSLALEGKTDGALLFHNGHWGNWHERAMEAAINANHRIPSGIWSDTRAIAWLMSIYGPGFLEFLPSQRGVYFSPDKTDIYVGPGWKYINEVWCSNDSPSYGAITKKVTTFARSCTYGKCIRPAQAGKDNCEQCEKEIKERLRASLNRSSETGTTSAVTSLVPTSGGTKERLGPLAQAMSLAEAEGIYANQGMAKAAIKKFRKLYGQLRRARADKKKDKIKERISLLTVQIKSPAVPLVTG